MWRTADVLSAVDRARLARAEDLHLTLRFFGEADEARVAAIKAALLPLRQAAFRVELTGVGAFRSVGAIYAVVQPSASLDTLAEAVSEALAWQGIPRELWPFQPHVTLARVRRALPQAELDRWSGGWTPLSFVADRVALFHNWERAASAGAQELDGAAGSTTRYEVAQTFHFDRTSM